MSLEIAPIEVAPGAIHLPGWLDLDEQRSLVAECREWSRGPAGMHAVRTRGGVMSARTACLGWYWYPYRYSRTADDADGTPVKAFPASLGELGRRAIAETRYDWSDYEPDVALINYYDKFAKMGLHQDRDERSRAPVVSISLGDTGVFRFGNDVNRARPWADVELQSGDLFVFGGPARLAFHGVLRIRPGTGPAIGIADCSSEDQPGDLLDLIGASGRLNVTIRESGLD